MGRKWVESHVKRRLKEYGYALIRCKYPYYIFEKEGKEIHVECEDEKTMKLVFSQAENIIVIKRHSEEAKVSTYHFDRIRNTGIILCQKCNSRNAFLYKDEMNKSGIIKCKSCKCYSFIDDLKSIDWRGELYKDLEARRASYSSPKLLTMSLKAMMRGPAGWALFIMSQIAIWTIAVLILLEVAGG